jgi:protein O-mannosyl-transferase
MSGTVESGKQRSQFLFICGGLLLVTLAVYWPAFSCDFVNYDDLGYVTENSHIQAGLNWATVKWAFTAGYESNWHPLTWLSHTLDYQLYGPKPAGHHLTNLLFHLANTLLLFGVLRRMTGAMWSSAFVAALFACHPSHVESVAWVSERKDVLSAFFWLLTMFAYARYAEMSKVQGPRSKVFYSLALLCFALGLMCKPMLVTLPFVLLLLDYWPLGRICDLRFTIYEPSNLKGTPSTNAPSVLRPLPDKSKSKIVYRKLLWEKVPFLLLAIASSVVTYIVQRKGGAVSTSISLGARMANALVSYLRYVGKLLWPENLSVLYPHPGSWPLGLVIGAAVFIAAMSAGVIWSRRRQPYLLVGWFWFLGTLVPVIGLVQVGVQSMADRYTYVPAIGIFVMLAWGVPPLLDRFPQRRWLLGGAGGVVLSGCLIVTSLQVGYWKNSETLFRRAVTVTKNNYLAYNNLGFYLSNQGKAEEAMTNYQKSLEINPNYEDAQNNLGHALARKGRLDEAILHYELALRIKPGLAEAHNNLGNALGDQGKLDEAISHYLTALQIDPENENALNNLGIARAMQGRSDEAWKLLTEATRLKPSDAGAHGNLGTLLASQNKLDEAAKQFQIALQLSPDDPKSQNNLGNVLSELGRLDEAKAHYLAALKLNAENPEANYNLGLVLLRQGKREEAVSHFTEALRLRPNYPDAQRQLTELAHPKGQ